jgi:Flp pilus assembly pilin Flp
MGVMMPSEERTREMISRMRSAVWRLWSDRRAQDLVEYSLAAAFVAVAVSAFFPPAISPAISGIFSRIVDLFGQVQ